VEDNATNQKLVLRMLKSLGHPAHVVANGLEAISALEDSTYDIVLMDVQMPGLDGIRATELIRERWPGNQRQYIIALTADAMEQDRDRCLRAGMDDYLSKPYRSQDLAAALRRARPADPAVAPPR
jgi:CheY-like chemotaxis protein